MTLEELANQVKRLRDVNDIKDITYDYWYAVDTKNPEKLRTVFAPGRIQILFEGMPEWNDRDEFVQFYTDMAMDPARQENHFGSSPRIEIAGPDSAIGNWRLHMFAYNSDLRSVIRVTGEYDAKYVTVDGKWKISSFIFKRHSIDSLNIANDGNVTSPEFGGVPTAATAHLYGADTKTA